MLATDGSRDQLNLPTEVLPLLRANICKPMHASATGATPESSCHRSSNTVSSCWSSAADYVFVMAVDRLTYENSCPAFYELWEYFDRTVLLHHLAC